MTRKIEMVDGPLWPNLIYFAFPVMLTGILQLLFNAADIIVVGRFTGPQALAAVGSTSSLINLLVNLFVGVAVGANVLLGQAVGARDVLRGRRLVQTATWFGLWGGLFLLVVGVLFSKQMLIWMGTPADVLMLASLYLSIYFLGMPAAFIYNFGAALLRAVGDTRRPLYFLIMAGLLNVVCNLIFVIVFKMGVAGVGLATVLSQYMSAFLILLSLSQGEDALHFHLRHSSFDFDILKEMMVIGLPAGVQGVLFNISNVLIQSSVNSFGSSVMAGNAAAANIEGFVYIAMNSVYQTSLSFTSQNVGAKAYNRIVPILWRCLVLVTLVGVGLGVGAWSIGPTLLGIYSHSPTVIAYGMERLGVVCMLYALCGMMDTVVGSLRGMGYSMSPMIVSLIAVCVLRVVWIFTVFASVRTLYSLYISYPITWILAVTCHLMIFMVVKRRFR